MRVKIEDDLFAIVEQLGGKRHRYRSVRPATLAAVSLDVRTLTPHDVPAYVRAMRAGFNEHVEDGEIDMRRPSLVLDRTLAVFDGDRVIGTARSFPTSLTTPGQGELPAAAVTNVTVLPTDRRRGVLTAMMNVQLEDAASRHEPVAILIAS
jgi:predicted N-acetyltransferase YhbS